MSSKATVNKAPAKQNNGKKNKIKGSNIGVVEMDLHRGKKIKMSSFLIPRTSHTVIYHVTRIVF